MLLGLAAASACLKVPQQSASLGAMEATEVTATELQMRVYEAGRRFSWIIESAADTIAKSTSDIEIRRRSLRWKVVFIPLAEEASLRADPVIAAADLWGFAIQQSDFLQTGSARAMFGEFQPIAVAAADTLERIAAEVAGRMRPGGRVTEKDERDMREWARRHPIEGSSLGRESVLSSNWKMLSITESSLTGTVASVQRSLTGVTNQLNYISEGAFKRVLWQSELAAADMMPLFVSLGRTAMDSLFAGQERRVFDAVTEQRVATFASIGSERALVLDAIRGERRAVTDALTAERIAVLDAMRAERVAVLEAIRSERIATLASVDSIAQRSIDHAAAVAGRFMLWVFLGMLAIAIAGGTSVGIAKRGLRREA
jgi:hypothetical protein